MNEAMKWSYVVVVLLLCLASSVDSIRIVDGLIEQYPSPSGSPGMYRMGRVILLTSKYELHSCNCNRRLPRHG